MFNEAGQVYVLVADGLFDVEARQSPARAVEEENIEVGVSGFGDVSDGGYVGLDHGVRLIERVIPVEFRP